MGSGTTSGRQSTLTALGIDRDEFLNEVRLRVDDGLLMDKYDLDKKQLYRIFDELFSAGLLQPSDLLGEDDSGAGGAFPTGAVLCPNCGVISDPDLQWCLECGELLKAEIQLDEEDNTFTDASLTIDAELDLNDMESLGGAAPEGSGSGSDEHGVPASLWEIEPYDNVGSADADAADAADDDDDVTDTEPFRPIGRTDETVKLFDELLDFSEEGKSPQVVQTQEQRPDRTEATLSLLAELLGKKPGNAGTVQTQTVPIEPPPEPPTPPQQPAPEPKPLARSKQPDEPDETIRLESDILELAARAEPQPTDVTESAEEETASGSASTGPTGWQSTIELTADVKQGFTLAQDTEVFDDSDTEDVGPKLIAEPTVKLDVDTDEELALEDEERSLEDTGLIDDLDQPEKPKYSWQPTLELVPGPMRDRSRADAAPPDADDVDVTMGPGETDESPAWQPTVELTESAVLAAQKATTPTDKRDKAKRKKPRAKRSKRGGHTGIGRRIPALAAAAVILAISASVGGLIFLGVIPVPGFSTPQTAEKAKSPSEGARNAARPEAPPAKQKVAATRPASEKTTKPESVKRAEQASASEMTDPTQPKNLSPRTPNKAPQVAEKEPKSTRIAAVRPPTPPEKTAPIVNEPRKRPDVARPQFKGKRRLPEPGSAVVMQAAAPSPKPEAPSSPSQSRAAEKKPKASAPSTRSAQSGNLNSTPSGQSASLIAAAKRGDLTQVDRLLEQGVSVHSADSSGMTALMAAAATGRAEMVKRLLEAGANVAARDANGKTALDYAYAPGVVGFAPVEAYRETVRLLKTGTHRRAGLTGR